MDNYQRRKPVSNIKDESDQEEYPNEDRNNRQEVRADGKQRQKKEKDLASNSGRYKARKAESR